MYRLTIFTAPVTAEPMQPFKEFIANHSFIFFITTTEEVVFMGKFVG